MSGDRTFGRRLREARVRAGLSQSEISKARLSRYENGHVAPSIKTLERLAKALGVSQASLLDDERAPMEEFLGVLQRRGVAIGSSAEAVALGNAVADILAARREDPAIVAPVRREPAHAGMGAGVSARQEPRS